MCVLLVYDTCLKDVIELCVLQLCDTCLTDTMECVYCWYMTLA